MMGTRAAAFTGKISNLRESLLRIQNGTMPQPTCVDLANTIKYFCQVFHDFKDFKDIENVRLYASEKCDRMELIKTLPSFDYCGLYKALTQLVDILPLIQPTSNGLDQLGSNLLMLFKCLVPFLDQANMETMPYLVSTLFMSLPASLHKEILDTLCFNLLPFTIDQQQKHTAAMLRKAKSQQAAKRGNGVRGGGGGGASKQAAKPAHCIVRIEDSSGPILEDSNGLRGGESIENVDRDFDFDFDGAAGENGQQDHEKEGKGKQEDEEESSEEDEYALLSVTSILMTAFHYITEPVHHSQLVECLMKLKNNVFEDLLYVIAYGTTRARCPAVELLFRYWPDICPSQLDRKNNSQASKLKHVAWQPTKCQNKNCSFTTLGDDEAVKMCLDFKISISLSGLPPPMLVCLDCVDSIYKQQLAYSTSPAAGEHESIQAMDDYTSKFIDLLLPMERVSKLCENKRCKSTDRSAIGTCFDIECSNYNCKKPIRYCRTCFVSIHEPCEANNYDLTLQTHIRHSSIKLTIFDNEESVNNFIEAIISLLKEAAPADRPSKDSERYLRSLMGPMSQFSTDNKDLSIATEEKQLISQYGIWLMTGLCKTVDKIGDELLGRLLGMLFQWFHFTACLPDDQAGSALEKLKGECIKGWIMGVKNKRIDVFISCLLPHPIDCSKIGGHWEVWPDTAHQIKEGFKRLLCLVPYDIITDDVWDEIMPYWMECFRHEVPENELSELKILLSKVFDPELSPLGFETKQMYNFISSRFEDPNNTNQEQTLYWLQIITMLEIPIPIDFLFKMLKSGVKSLASIRSNELNKLRIAGRLATLDKLPTSRGHSDKSSLTSSNGKARGCSSSSSSSSSSSVSSNSSSASSSSSSGASNSLENDNEEQDEENAHEDEDDDENEDQDDGESESGDDSASNNLSVLEDDVMLPTARDDDWGAQKSGTASSRAPLSQRERQAQARAAFSAKLLQHASMLDSQNSSVSATISPSVSSSVGLNESTKMVSPKLSLAIPSTSRNHPLRSTTSSHASSEQQAKERRDKNKRKRKNKNKNKKRKAKGRDQKDVVNCKKGAHGQARKARKSYGRPKLKLHLGSVEEYLMNKIDNNLVCYILMMDILLKQLDLQEINSHRGLDGKEAQQAIELINTIISTPWIGRHTCCDSLPVNSRSSASTAKDSQQEGSTGGSGANSKMFGSSASSNNKLFVGGSSQSEHTLRPDSPQCSQTASNNIHSFSHCAQGFEHEDSFETCVFCEIISTFHQLAMFLIEFFSPIIEVSICEVSQEAANGEFDGKPDYSRIGLDHLDPSPSKINEQAAEDEFTFTTQALLLEQHQQQQQQQQHQQDPSSPFSPSYFGPSLKKDILDALPKELQLCYNLLVQFHQYQTPDIVSQLLQMIKLISLHSQVLSKAAKYNPQFITWCQHNMLVNKLWSLCQLESSEIARTCVPLLLHCITLPWGVRLFRDLVERDFNSENWLSRFRAVERVVTIAYFCEPSTIKNSTLLQSTMASAFCYVVRCLDDIEAIVAQRALVSLEMMKTSSLKLLLWCLEVQFDYIIIDRPMILRSVFQLYNHLRDRRFLTWEFFLNRFDTIFMEAQIYLQQTGEIPSFTMQDLKNTNTKSEIYQKKISRAKEALQETHQSRSLSNRFHEKQFSSAKKHPEEQQQYKNSIKLQYKRQQQHRSADMEPNLGSKSNLIGKQTGSEDNTAPAPANGIERRRLQSPVERVMQHGRSTSSRYQAIAYLTSQSVVKRKNSKFMTNLAMQSVPPLMLPDKLHQHLPNSFVDDGSKLNEIAQENHVLGVVHRVCDEDRDTNHSLIFLLMQFFSKPDPSHPQSVKSLNRNHQIVLRHLNILMGYSIARKNFLIPATNLRLLPVFNAFLTSLPKVLDFNYSLGTILLDTCLPVLIYCPASDDVQFDLIKTPTYSLWPLNPLMRQSWLMSVMTFLYKYQFGQTHLKNQVQMLMRIVINTLESHLNCSTLDANSLDKCLVKVRDSTATQDLSADDQHQVAKGGPSMAAAATTLTTSSQEATTNVASASSPSRGGQSSHKVVEMLELQTKEEESSRDIDRLAQSVSSVSLRHGGQSLAAKAAKESSHPTSVKALIKADTSDSLNVKAKLFQRKSDAVATKEKGKINSAGASSTRINVTLGESPAGKSSCQIEMQNTSDERLLPIGLQSHPFGSGSKTKSAFDLPAAERLLPIGCTSGLSGSSRSEQQQQQQHPQQPVVLEEHQQVARAETPTLQTAAPTNLVSIHPANSPISTSESSSARTTIQLQQYPHLRSSDASSANQPNNVEPSSSSSSGATKINRRRFGAGGGKLSHSETLKQASKDQQESPEMGGGKSSAGLSAIGRSKGKSAAKLAGKDYVAKHMNPIQPSFSSPSLLNEQLAQINRHSFVQEFSDKDISMCLVILETFIHHEPSMAAPLLPNILHLVAKYSSANLDLWQSGSNAHLVGGSMFVARQFIRVALHDFMENNIFHQIFTSHFTGFEFYKSMATALADFTDLNQLAPLSRLFDDLIKQKNLPPASSLMAILENVATYFECIIAELSTVSLSWIEPNKESSPPMTPLQITWLSFITNWENFLRKLILALPRYSGSTIATTSSGGRADGATTMAHSGGQSGAAPAQIGSNLAGTSNQFLASRAPATEGGGAGGGSGAGGGQENANFTFAAAIPSSCSMIMTPIMRIILATSKISYLEKSKTINDPYSKIISYTVLNSQFKYEHLLEINHNCCRGVQKDRERYLIQRTIAYELVQVLKFRFFILEENLLILLLFILQDVGGTLAPKLIRDSLKIDQSTLNQVDSHKTNVSECLRQYIGDLLEFITDVHAISRINDNLIGSHPSSINRDSFGGHVKAAISQYLALEMSLNNGADNRTVPRYLPWLYQSPSIQQGPREFIDCVSHIRQLSWIILGSLQHSSLMKCGHLQGGHHSGGQTSSASQHFAGQINCQPIPIEKNGNVAEHVQVILAGFAEQSKESVLHMSGLFHAFLLCQLWTMYCENICSLHPANSEQYQFCQSTLDDFWAKITPGVLRLVSHSRVMSEMVSTHFLQLIESLIESNSSILIRYLPMWNSVFYSYKRRNKSGTVAIKLQKCIEWQPPDLDDRDVEQNNKRLINWLEKVQYKMSHIEIQSSQAAPFYLT